MSFTDFLRFHWVPAEGGNQQLVQPQPNNNNHNDRHAARNVPHPLNLDLPHHQQPVLPNIPNQNLPHHNHPLPERPPERQLTPRRRMSINKVHVPNNLRRSLSNRTSKSDSFHDPSKGNVDKRDSKASASSSNDAPEFISISSKSSNSSFHQHSLHSKEPVDFLMKVDSLDTKHTQRLYRSNSIKRKSLLANDSADDASFFPLEDSYYNSNFSFEGRGELSPAMEENSEFNFEENEDESEGEGVLLGSPQNRISRFSFGLELDNLSDEINAGSNATNTMDDKDIIPNIFSAYEPEVPIFEQPQDNIDDAIPVPIEPLQPPQQLPPVDNARNNDLGFNFEEFGNDVFDQADAQEVGMEVRIALFDLFGLEGSFYIMLRNAFWLLGFIGLFMVTFFSLPYIIGFNFAQILGRFYPHYPIVTTAFETVIPLKIRQIIELVFELSVKYQNPIHFFDLSVIALGFCTIFAMVYTVDAFFFSVFLHFPQARFAIASLRELLSKSAVVIKVGMLLVIRIFVLPVMLGSVILMVCGDALFEFTAADWANFLSVNCIGAYALAWVSGITFMLSMTISVLQLREVLHPDIFAKIIRPQEAHIDLIASLVNESASVHIRRIFISMLVYLFLMTFLLYSPILIAKNALKFGIEHSTWVAQWAEKGVLKLELHVWYFIPQIQLPLEILLSHITFLSILDKKKDVLGRLQHFWLVNACKVLGLTIYLLPLPRIKLRRRVDVLHDANTEIDLDNNNILVGDPLPRPPPGWDIRAPHTSTRWAWGPEEPSQLERNVAPRVAPTYCFLRCTLLIIASWLLMATTTLCCTLLPVVLGRLSQHCSEMVPARLMHDPVSYVLGLAFLLPLFTLLTNMGNRAARNAAAAAAAQMHAHMAPPQPQPQQQPDELQAMQLRQPADQPLLPDNVTAVFTLLKEQLNPRTQMPFRVQLTAFLLALICTTNEILLGAMLSYAWTSYENSESCAAYYSRSWLSIWLRGMVTVYGSLFLLVNHLTGPALTKLIGGESMARWAEDVRTTLNVLQRVLNERHWVAVESSLRHILDVVFMPVSKYILASLGVYMSFVCSCFPKEKIPMLLHSLVFSYENKEEIQQLWQQFDSCLCANSWSFLTYPFVYVLCYQIGCYSKILYDKIRDDNFLVGRTLQNINRNP